MLGVLLGWAVVASLFVANRLAPRSLFLGQGRAMQSALHEATAILPDLRRGLSAASAQAAAPHLRALTQAIAVALADREDVIAFDGAGADHHCASVGLPGSLVARGDRVRIEPHIGCPVHGCPLRAAIIAPLRVTGERVGSLIAFYPNAERLTAEDAQVIGEAASLVSAQIELSELEAQGERLARAELRALRAQISPHFIYNALAAVASYIHSRPDDARELLSEFAEFTRYAFRGQRPVVTLADELEYVEKYLRLEQARFGDRLRVRVRIPARVRDTTMPVLSLQPLVENAVRHGLEERGGAGLVEIVARDLGAEVQLCVRDDGVGMDVDFARGLLGAGDRSAPGGGIGLSNVQARLRGTFGAAYGLQVHSRPGCGTTVVMTLPKGGVATGAALTDIPGEEATDAAIAPGAAEPVAAEMTHAGVRS
jgi:two-component system LytT family sensor kinase